MGRWRLLACFASLALLGAILAFALDSDDPVALGIRLEPLGLILLAAGAVLLAGWTLAQWRSPALAPRRRRRAPSAPTSFQAIGGLIAVVANIESAECYVDGDQTT